MALFLERGLGGFKCRSSPSASSPQANNLTPAESGCGWAELIQFKNLPESSTKAQAFRGFYRLAAKPKRLEYGQ